MSSSSTEHRRRIREQLREFYGDPTVSNNVRFSESTKSDVPPEMNLDSEFFNVSKYVTDLLRRESLKELVETDTQLMRTVRHLDKELQELVYRNYAKFISSTDTIREMRENITEMDAKLQALSNNVEIIDRVSNKISEKLQSHQTRVEEMIVTSRTLRKVQFLLGLADTMRRLIERREYGECVKHWVAGDSFLSKYVNLSSITKIHDECKTLARELYAKLHETVSTTCLNDSDAINTIRCVVENMRLMQATSLFERKNVNDANTRDVIFDPLLFEAEILNTLMENVSRTFMAGVYEVNGAITAALTLPHFAAIDRTCWQEVLDQVDLQHALVQLKNICALFYSSSERVYALFGRENDVTVSLLIVEKVQPVLIDIISPITTKMSELPIAVLNTIVTNAGGAVEMFSEIKSCLDFVFTTLAKQLKYYSKTLKALGENYLDNAHSNQNCQYAALVEESILDIFRRFLEALELKISEGATTTGPITTTRDPVYARLLYFCLTRFAFSCAATVAEWSGVEALIGAGALVRANATKVTRRCAHVARVCAHRGSTLLGQLHLRLLAPAFCPADTVDPTSPGAQNYGVARCLPEFVRQLHELHGALREGFFCSGSSKKPKEQHSADNLRGLSGLYSNIGSGHSSGKVSLRKPVVTFTRQTGNAMQSSVDFIFSKHSNSTAELHVISKEHTAAFALLSAVLYLLKGLVEHVRKNNFTRNGFQSVQINCTFLLYFFTPLALSTFLLHTKNTENLSLTLLDEWLLECKDSSLFKELPHLINECCTCAYERCSEKVPLTAAVVEKLVMSAIEEMEF